MKDNKQLSIQRLKLKAKQIRKDILQMSYKAGVGHIASALSVADILTVLYNGILKVDPKKPENPRRDRFILSKGHAAAALYTALYRSGFLSRQKMHSFCHNKESLGMHPKQNLKHGIEFSTGSLGHGLSVGTGMALGLRKKAKVFVLLSDAELNEGSTWEAVMFARHHKLDNLTAIIDDNSLQAFGRTKDILNLQPLGKKWLAFGWAVKTVNGHNLEELQKLMLKMPFDKDKPSVIIAKTIAGKGVSFMENKLEWHYWPMTKKQYQNAVKQIK